MLLWVMSLSRTAVFIGAVSIVGLRGGDWGGQDHLRVASDSRYLGDPALQTLSPAHRKTLPHSEISDSHGRQCERPEVSVCMLHNSVSIMVRCISFVECWHAHVLQSDWEFQFARRSFPNGGCLECLMIFSTPASSRPCAICTYSSHHSQTSAIFHTSDFLKHNEALFGADVSCDF